LVQTEDGNWGWREDGSLDFDISAAYGEVMDPRMKEALTLTAGEMLLGGGDDLVEKLFGSGGPDSLIENNFMSGTISLVGASIKAEGLISLLSNETMAHKKNLNALEVNNQLNMMNELLLLAQNSGIIVKNDYEVYEGEGTIFARDDNSPVFQGSKDGFRVKYWAEDLSGIAKIQSHPEWDLNVRSMQDRGMLAPENGSLSLMFNLTGGLKSVFTDAPGQERLTFTHSSSASIMNYIAAFGMEGTSLDENYSLNGIRENTVIATMGNTGTWTTGAHVHLAYDVMTRNGWKRTNTSQYTPYSNLDFKIKPIDNTLSGLDSNQWTIDLASELFSYKPEWKDTFYNSLYSDYQRSIFDYYFND